ncbi:MAG: MFS transporter [Pseudomonadota bacterium]|nr:MFS transporter [Pseudomonadota bacterium]
MTQPPLAAPDSPIAQIRAFDRVFWLCIFMELMERMAYYGVRLVVPVYMVLGVGDGGPGLDHVQKGTILACWAAMQSWLPTFAGGFSDRYGYKRTIAVSVFLKAGGYFLMSQADGFGSMLIGTQLLAAGTGLFKPGIQGTMAHSIVKSRGAESMGWGLFYQSVNVGAAVSAYIPMYTRDVFGWPSVFLACTAIVLVNLIPLFFYEDPVDERTHGADERSVFALVKESVGNLFTSPVLLGFIFISAGFWFSFHQLFDMLPNYVDDWTDTTVLLRDIGATFGFESYTAAAAAGETISQERLLNVNALMIMFTMFVFAWLSGKLRVLTSTMVGMGIATAAFGLFVFTANVYLVLLGVVVFTVGEMLSSPKRQEYMSSLAPPGKRALFLGYANMPDGIGWVLGSLVAGSTYEEHGDKVNLARAHLATVTDPAAVQAARTWISTVTDRAAQAAGMTPDAAKEWLATQGTSPAALAEIQKKLDAPIAQGLAEVAALPDAALVQRVAELVPRGEVIDHLVASVPSLVDASGAREFLFASYDPGQVWIPFIAISAVSVVGMFFYDRWVQGRAVAARQAA